MRHQLFKALVSDLLRLAALCLLWTHWAVQNLNFPALNWFHVWILFLTYTVFAPTAGRDTEEELNNHLTVSIFILVATIGLVIYLGIQPIVQR